jgi:outer membrane lipoprotein-sorting protein
MMKTQVNRVATRGRWIGVLALLGVVTTPLTAPAQTLTATEIVARSQEAFLAAGDDMRARLTMRLINKGGRERLREMTMLRIDLEGGDQKYFIYFHRPGDVRDMSFMVWTYQGRDDDRWLFVPAVKMVRRLAADDSRSSFVGSDFTYEDVSGRDVAADTHRLTGEEPCGDRTCHVVESVPVDDEAEFGRKVSRIDTLTFLPITEEYYDRQGELARVYTAEEIVDVGGHPTAVRRVMTDVKRGHRTEVVFDDVAYDTGLDADLFAERSLRRPPSDWIR